MAYRRLEDPAFRKQVQDARAEMVERALGQLSKGAGEAGVVLRRLLRSNSDAIKLGACWAILELGSRLRESVELEQRIAALESHQTAENAR